MPPGYMLFRPFGPNKEKIKWCDISHPIIAAFCRAIHLEDSVAATRRVLLRPLHSINDNRLLQFIIVYFIFYIDLIRVLYFRLAYLPVNKKRPDKQLVLTRTLFLQSKVFNNHRQGRWIRYDLIVEFTKIVTTVIIIHWDGRFIVTLRSMG